MSDPIDKQKIVDELDLELNPPPKPELDVLANRDIQRESPPLSEVHDFADLPLHRPTENLGITPAPSISHTPITPLMAEKEQENYKPDPRLVSYVLRLIREGNKKLGSLKFDLEYLQSEGQLRKILENSLYLGHINEQQYQEMLGYLGQPEVEEQTIKSIKEKSVDNQDFKVPQELIVYLNSLMKLDIGPRLILEALRRENISRDEVLTTLSDGYLHLKILSEDEYRKTLEILGQPEEDIVKHLENTPVTDFSSENTALDSNVGEIKEESGVKNEEKNSEPILEPTSEPISKPKPELESETYFKPEILEQVDIDLNNARSEYATQYVAWKNQLREKRNKFAKMMSDLGVERQMPEGERPTELIEAEKRYIEAKKRKIQNDPRFKNAVEDVYKLGDSSGFNEVLFGHSEEEFGRLQDEISGLGLPSEKDIMAKSLEKLRKISLMAKIPIINSLLSEGGIKFDFSTARQGSVSGVTLDLHNFAEEEKDQMRSREKQSVRPPVSVATKIHNKSIDGIRPKTAIILPTSPEPVIPASSTTPTETIMPESSEPVVVLKQPEPIPPVMEQIELEKLEPEKIINTPDTEPEIVITPEVVETSRPVENVTVPSRDTSQAINVLKEKIAEQYKKGQPDNHPTDVIEEKPTVVSFEGGEIHIIRNKEGLIRVLLNGKEIAKGIVGTKGVKLEYNPSLPKSGFLFADNAYERAFKQAKKELNG